MNALSSIANRKLLLGCHASAGILVSFILDDRVSRGVCRASDAAARRQGVLGALFG